MLGQALRQVHLHLQTGTGRGLPTHPTLHRSALASCCQRVQPAARGFSSAPRRWHLLLRVQASRHGGVQVCQLRGSFVRPLALGVTLSLADTGQCWAAGAEPCTLALSPRSDRRTQGNVRPPVQCCKIWAEPSLSLAHAGQCHAAMAVLQVSSLPWVGQLVQGSAAGASEQAALQGSLLHRWQARRPTRASDACCRVAARSLWRTSTSACSCAALRPAAALDWASCSCACALVSQGKSRTLAQASADRQAGSSEAQGRMRNESQQGPQHIC